ncbi:hypothetical protein OQA88_935 [Cercophora sp. LCS_1]
MCNDGLHHVTGQALQDVKEEISTLIAQIIASEPENESHKPSKNVTIYKGTILTMANGQYTPQEAMAIHNDTILAVGTFSDVTHAVSLTDLPSATHDLGTKCIVPGFVEPHIHLLLTALFTNLASTPILDMTFPTIRTLPSAIDLLASSIPHDPKTWIIAFGYDPSLVTDHLEPTLSLLDSVATTNPIFIINQSGHLAYCNTAAFHAAGFPTQKGQPHFPESDDYEKDENGNLSGVVKEDAVTTMAGYLPKSLFAHMIANVRPTLRKWASRGCTTVFDCGVGMFAGLFDVDIIAGLISVRTFPRFRGVLAAKVVEQMGVQKFLEKHGRPPWDVGRVSVQGVKIWLDGSTQGLTAAVKEEYLHPPRENPRGKLNYEVEDLEELVKPLAEKGWQVVMHANGGRAVEQGLDVLEKVGRGTYMHRLEHVTADVNKELIERAKELNVGVSHLVAHVRKWGKTFEEWVLGEERAKRIDPFRDDVKTGAVYSFHSDSPVSEVDPLRYVDTAVTRKTENGSVLGEDQTIEVEDAFRGITYNPAKQLGALGEIGTLEKGKKADFVILSVDPRLVPKGELDGGCEVVETWVGGVQIK